ncbi:conserved Plasmodium protein, unknown function [Babesia microti strain RI]|uniref:RAP domain-containing protein n=1 Tax=Babesia microti (strain RI) TaxID=1133968 RepID=A0A1R4AA45_BABMR|nr:conserved Plasmodium protein, unknown function [Babesia microti strain RI]SJK85866.1 conserved Plasmodium protein, unknown function [Babesia microti strain RI]|eukprot:XP_021338077.1 conserved Plasmodium protein, unknown function [Babesia microti strain RI]
MKITGRISIGCRFNHICKNAGHLLSHYYDIRIFCNSNTSNTSDGAKIEAKLVSILDNIKGQYDNLNIDCDRTIGNLSITNQNYLLEGIHNFALNTDKRVIYFGGKSFDVVELVQKISIVQLQNMSELIDKNNKDKLNELMRSSFKITKLLRYISSDELMCNLLKLRSNYYKLSDDLPKKLFLKALMDHMTLGKFVYDRGDNKSIDSYNELTTHIKSQFTKIFDTNFINTDDLITIVKLNSELCDHIKSFPSFVYKNCIKKLCKVKKLSEYQVDEIVQVIISKKFACSTRFMSLFIDNMRYDTLTKLSICELSTFSNYLSITYSNVKPSPRVIKYVDQSLKLKLLNGETNYLREIVNILYFLAKNTYTESESFPLAMSEWIKQDFLTSPAFDAFLDKLIWISLKFQYGNHEVIAKICEISRSNASNYTIIDVVKYLYSLSKYMTKSLKHQNYATCNNNLMNDNKNDGTNNQLLGSIQGYIMELKVIAWNRLNEMEDIQCLSNYLFAVTSTLNDFKIEDYRTIGDRILHLINLKHESVKGEAITQILWSFQKNNILHQQLIVTLSKNFARLLNDMNSGQISLCAQTLSTYSLLDEGLTLPLLEHSKKRLLALNKKGRTSIAEFTKLLSTIWACVTAGCIDKFPQSRGLIRDIFQNYHWQDFIRNSTISTKRQLVHVVIDADIGITNDNEKVSNSIDKRVLDDATNSCHNLDDMAMASISQYKVRRVLSGLNVSFLAESIITTGVVADFELKDRKITLEIDGPCHYNLICEGEALDTDICYGKTMYRYNGKTICRNRLFEKLGYKVISIPWFICHRQGLGDYIKRKLDNIDS